MAYYDRQNDRITTMLPKPLRQSPRVFHNVTTSDDPKIREVGIAVPSRSPLGRCTRAAL